MDNKEFSRILPCYFGQKVITKDGRTGWFRALDISGVPELGMSLYTIAFDDDALGEKMDVPSDDWTVFNTFEDDSEFPFKLILRKMEDITFEEYKQWALHILPDAKEDKLKEFYSNTIKFARLGLYKFKVNTSWTLSQIIEFTNYLRSIGVDVDGLIESGYAIHQNQVKG